MKTRTRIAPSPTGFPHVGTIFQALINRVIADQAQGQFILRIEDTDRTRYVADAETKIIQALSSFDLVPDESPQRPGKFGPYRQSERLEIYHKHAQQLIDQGDAYYCFCTAERLNQVRNQMQQQGIPPMYDKHCRHLDPDIASQRARSEPHVIRMKIPPDETITLTDAIRGQISIESNTVDDQVIVKSDGFPTYHLAVVVDDHLMQITHMVRGEEWISSTPKHILLYQYFGWQPPLIIHTPLLRNPDRSKLSKRHGHASVDWYQEQGYLKEAVVNFLITRVWNHPLGQEIFSYDQIVKHFDLKDMHIQGPIVDLKKLDWLNGHWIRNLSEAELTNRATAYLPSDLSKDRFTQILPFIKERLVKLSEIPQLTHYFTTAPTLEIRQLSKQSKMEPTESIKYLDQVISTLDDVDDWKVDILESSLRQLQQDLDLKPRPAFMTIRYVLTGETATPPLFDVMVLLGKSEVITRLQAVISMLQAA